MNTDKGRATVQKIVDDLAAVFIKDVARFRGVSPAAVIDKFGKGGVEVGKHAVKAGMADTVDQFENVLAGVQRRTGSITKTNASTAAAPAVPVPQWTAEEAAKMLAEQRAADAARVAAAEAERKAKIDAMWKKAADTGNAGLPSTAVKSEI
jgi:ClpP class serine protease